LDGVVSVRLATPFLLSLNPVIMSLFDTFSEGCLTDSANIIGEIAFTIGGINQEFAGVLNEYTAQRELDVGGLRGTYSATIVAKRREIAASVSGQLEKTLTGRKVIIEGRTFKISTVDHDSISVTLTLENEIK
jgi:hypothetical protein